MTKDILQKRIKAKFRQARVRAKIAGTAERPRLAVFRSLRHIAVQMIDDQAGRTLISATDKEITDADKKGKKPVEVAVLVGQLTGEKAKQAGITQAVFDRRSYKYHGRVKAVAEGARAKGLKF